MAPFLFSSCDKKMYRVKFTEAVFNCWSSRTIRFQYEAALSELRVRIRVFNYPDKLLALRFGSLGIFVPIKLQYNIESLKG